MTRTTNETNRWAASQQAHRMRAMRRGCWPQPSESGYQSGRTLMSVRRLSWGKRLGSVSSFSSCECRGVSPVRNLLRIKGEGGNVASLSRRLSKFVTRQFFSYSSSRPHRVVNCVVNQPSKSLVLKVLGSCSYLVDQKRPSAIFGNKKSNKKITSKLVNWESSP